MTRMKISIQSCSTCRGFVSLCPHFAQPAWLLGPRESGGWRSYQITLFPINFPRDHGWRTGEDPLLPAALRDAHPCAQRLAKPVCPHWPELPGWAQLHAPRAESHLRCPAELHRAGRACLVPSTGWQTAGRAPSITDKASAGLFPARALLLLPCPIVREGIYQSGVIYLHLTNPNTFCCLAGKFKSSWVGIIQAQAGSMSSSRQRALPPGCSRPALVV